MAEELEILLLSHLSPCPLNFSTLELEVLVSPYVGTPLREDSEWELKRRLELMCPDRLPLPEE